MAKLHLKIRARALRKEGHSIKEISKLLHVSVSSVSVWCTDIQLTNNQIKKLEKRMSDPNYGNRQIYLNRIKEETIQKVQTLKRSGTDKIGKLSKRDILLAGAALYWGEGFKKDHQVGLATSDSIAAKFFIYWLSKCFGIEKENLILRVTVNADFESKIQTIERYWASELGVNISHFSKPFYQKAKWKKVFENDNDYHGVIRIKVRKSINLLREILGYFEAFKNAVNVPSIHSSTAPSSGVE